VFNLRLPLSLIFDRLTPFQPSPITSLQSDHLPRFQHLCATFFNPDLPRLKASSSTTCSTLTFGAPLTRCCAAAAAVRGRGRGGMERHSPVYTIEVRSILGWFTHLHHGGQHRGGLDQNRFEAASEWDVIRQCMDGSNRLH